MKTLEQLHKEVISSEEMKRKFFEAAKDKDTLAAFLKDNGCEATLDELADFMKGLDKGAELGDAEVEAVAGGGKGDKVFFSFVSLGLGCGIAAIASDTTEDSADTCIERGAHSLKHPGQPQPQD